jgi:hypothetical protein
VTVDSHYYPLEHLELLDPRLRRGLSGLEISTPERLLQALRSPSDLARFARRAGISHEQLRCERERLRLILHRGLGLERARQLERLGIRTLEDLADWQPVALSAALFEQSSGVPRRFLERRAEVWLRGLNRGSETPTGSIR